MSKSDKSQSRIDQWYQRYPGSMVLDMERDYAQRMLSQCKGQIAVQVCGLSDLSLLDDSPMYHKILVTPYHNHYHDQPVIISDLVDLPLAPRSVDLMVLHHALEFSNNPKKLIAEAYQALTPEGQLIIFAFNRYSLWRVRQSRRDRRLYPWQGRFYAMSQIRRWVLAAGYRTAVCKTLCFRPPVHTAKMAQRLLFMEALGQLFVPGRGAVHLITAHKREEGMHLLQAEWWTEKIKIKSSVIEPTTRESLDVK